MFARVAARHRSSVVSLQADVCGQARQEARIRRSRRFSHTRDILEKRGMVNNGATQDRGRPRNYEVRADGELNDLRAGRGAARGAAIVMFDLSPCARSEAISLKRSRLIRRARQRLAMDAEAL